MMTGGRVALQLHAMMTSVATQVASLAANERVVTVAAAGAAVLVVAGIALLIASN
jgi:hypothetical protein